MEKLEKNYIIALVHDIIDRFDYYSFLDDAEKDVHDILTEAVKKIKAVKI